MRPDEQMIGTADARPNTVRDPVCGMYVDPQNARGGSVEHRGKRYYFCSPRCAERFQAEPEKYLAAKSPLTQISGIAPAQPQAALPSEPETDTGTPAMTYVCPMDPEVRESKPGPCPVCGMALEPEAIQYTCPMHPEIVRDQPGNCPICGMALEPRIATGAHKEDDSELRSMQRRFWVGIALSIPLLVLSMGAMPEGSPLRHTSPALLQWLQLALASPVVLWGGWPFFQRGWASLLNRRLNMFTLIAMGTGTAYVFSVFATVAPGLFPASF